MTNDATPTETPTLDGIIATAAAEPAGTSYHITPDWMQGRTAYGGLSTALSLDATLRAFPGDAPLRTAQVGFIGPVGGACTVQPRLLRQSKASRFIACDLESDQGYGVNALFAFMSGRESHLDHSIVPVPDAAEPDTLLSIPPHPARPTFTNKIDMRPCDNSGKLRFGLDHADVLMWVRWLEQPQCPAQVALLALADALPPAATALFRHWGPISSSTWTQHFLIDEPTTEDGWWLISSRSSHAQRGFSPQVMTIWNSRREIVSVGGQGVAIYA